jgi:signal transduction histidine kinase
LTSNSFIQRAIPAIPSTRLVSVFAGAPWRSALLFLLVFIGVFCVAGAVILTTTEGAMEDELKSQITENVNLLRDTAMESGRNGLIEFINEAAAPRTTRRYMLGLFTSKGERLAGDLVRLPNFREWGRVEAPTGGADYLAHVSEVRGTYIVAGGSLSFLNASIAGLWRALLLSGAVVALGALGIGYVFSLGVSAKLANMASTLDQVSRGNTTIRLPIGRSNDQIDRISRQINAHLDRLSDLMGNMRRTVTSIAHDLKSPLSRAYILLQEATAGPEEDKATEILEQAQDEIEQLSGIVDTVLRISRIEASDDRSSFTTFSADSLVSDIGQTYAPVVEGEGRVLSYEPAPGEGSGIYGDRRMLQQMLANLVENASRYCPEGGTITLSATALWNGKTKLTVCDNGPGIPADHREDVLQPFFQLSPERDSRGAGLGLALVKAIATRHHATLELEDNHPGLRVSVTFPAPDLLR